MGCVAGNNISIYSTLFGPIVFIIVRWIRIKIALNVVKASKLVQMKLIT